MKCRFLSNACLFLMILFSFTLTGLLAQQGAAEPSPSAPTQPKAAGSKALNLIPAQEKEAIERQIEEFVAKNKDKGYVAKRNPDGFLVVIDQQNKEVSLPPEVLLSPLQLPKEEIEKNIRSYFEQNKAQGWTMESDTLGHLVIRDKTGAVLNLPPELFERNNPASATAEAASKPSRQDIEKQIIEFAEKNKDKGYTWQRDQSGFIFIKDKEGKGVPVPREIFAKLDQEDHSQIEQMITKYAQEKGLLTGRDKDGLLVMKDQNGKTVPLPPEAIGKSKTDIDAIERKILAFAQEMKFTTERNEYGFLVVKDKNGVIVPVPLEALDQPSQPPLGGPGGPNQPFAPGMPAGS